MNESDHHVYAARIDAVIAQRDRLRGGARDGDRWVGAAIESFRGDPHRSLDPNLEVLASYLQPNDVLVDIGGGAGRISLPLALRCREVVNVDPSDGMAAAFRDSAAQAGITNARVVAGEWPEVEGVTGDIAVIANVTYFVREIVPFVRRLQESIARRVMITVWTTPPPSRNAPLFHLVYGEEEAPVPGHRELLAVLWELDILPDLLVLPGTRGGDRRAPTREAAIDNAVRSLAREQWALGSLPASWEAKAREAIDSHFDDLFEHSSNGFRPRWPKPANEVLITWETHPER